MQSTIERRCELRLRIVLWIAAVGAIVFVAGSAAFVIGICVQFREGFTMTNPYMMNNGPPPTVGLLIGGIGLLAALVGSGLLIGSLVCWCVLRKPRFRLRTCFIACLILAGIFACGPSAVRFAQQKGVSVHENKIIIEQSHDGRLSSPYHSEFWFLLLSPWYLVPVLVPALSVMLVINRIYR